MTVNELLEALQNLKENGQGESKIVIPLVEDGVHLGPSPKEDVKDVRVGFDWNSKKVFLETNNPLCVKK